MNKFTAMKYSVGCMVWLDCCYESVRTFVEYWWMVNRVVQICSCPLKLMNWWQAQNFLIIIKNQKNWKKINHLRLAQRPQSLSTYQYITYREFRSSTKSVYYSDVMHCQISIFELKMMVKIGVIFMPFLNSTGHFIKYIR